MTKAVLEAGTEGAAEHAAATVPAARMTTLADPTAWLGM
jgi:hypothetical protein